MTQFSTTYQPENEAKAKPKRAKIIRDALMLAMEREVEVEGKMTRRVVQMAEAIAKKAAEGDVQAFNSIADRIDGKVPQALVGEDEGPIKQVLEVTWKSSGTS